MLSVQSVNSLATRVPFKSAEPEKKDYIYSQEQYDADKSSIEKSLDDINAIVESAGNSKTMRTFGKVASIGIGAALGFVSMKFGAQGVAKFAKKGIEYAKNFVAKPELKQGAEKASETAKTVFGRAKDLAVKAFNWVKNTKLVQKVVDFVKNAIAKVKDSAFGEKIAKAAEKFSEKVSEKASKVAGSEAAGKAKGLYEKAVEKTTEILNKVSEKAKSWVVPAEGSKVTPLENGIVNLFAVSGGVSGGITALQEATKEDK